MFTTIQKAATAGVFSLALAASFVSQAYALDTTEFITAPTLESNHLNAVTNGKWFFYNDETDTVNNTLGSFVTGPATAPYGMGSTQISVSGTQRRNIATYRFKSTPLAQITTLKFSTYNPSAGNGGSTNRSGYLQFNVSFDGTDTWQRRMTFVPVNNGTVQPDTWQEWDAINSGNAMWTYSGTVWPGTATSGFTPRTWNDIIASYPNAKLRDTDSFFGVRVGEPYADGYTENIDGIKFGTASGVTTFDFEPYAAPSMPTITTPANGATVTQSALVKVDWTDATGSNPAFEYQYEAYSDAAYTSLVYSSSWLSASEIPTPGTPVGTYYLRVRSKDTTGTMSDWSNGATAMYKITVIADPVIVGPPTNKDQCKNGGWMTFNNPTFKNQGQCVKYVETMKEKKHHDDDDDREDHEDKDHSKDDKDRNEKRR